MQQLFAPVQVDAQILREFLRAPGCGFDSQCAEAAFSSERHDRIIDKAIELCTPIVKGLVTAHGGSIALRSQTGTGTCVTVIMPASRTRFTPEYKAAS